MTQLAYYNILVEAPLELEAIEEFEAENPLPEEEEIEELLEELDTTL